MKRKPLEQGSGTFNEAKASNVLVGLAIAGIGFSLVMSLIDKGGTAAASEAKLMSRPSRVLLIGDSLAVGMSDPFSKLASKSVHSFSGKGCKAGSAAGPSCTSIVGASVLYWSKDAAIQPVLAAYKPQVVLISLGTNDFQYGAAAKPKVRDAINALVSKIKDSGATPVWIDPVSMPFEDTAGVRESWKASGVPFFDSSGLVYKRSKDGVHLTQDGYQDWASKIWSWLLSQ